MSDRPSDLRLAQWADHIERLQWSALILDADWNLTWVSPELKEFIGTRNESELGYGLHLVEAFLQDSWLRTVHPDSLVRIFRDVAPFMVTDFERRGRDLARVLPEPLLSMLVEIEAAEIPSVWSTSFLYVDPRTESELPSYRVDVFVVRMYDHDGTPIGWLGLTFMGASQSPRAARSRRRAHVRTYGTVGRAECSTGGDPVL